MLLEMFSLVSAFPLFRGFFLLSNVFIPHTPTGENMKMAFTVVNSKYSKYGSRIIIIRNIDLYKRKKKSEQQ